MKKDLLKWVLLSVLVLATSVLLSFLLYLGPMLASFLIAILIEKQKYNIKNSFSSKLYFLTIGLVGVFALQTLILDVSKLTLTLNLAAFTLVFVALWLPNKN